MVRWLLIFALVTVVDGPIAAAQTQPGATPSELRRENDLLRERVHALEAALARMQEDVDRLTGLVESLQSELAAARRLLEEERARREAAEDAVAGSEDSEPAPMELAPEPSIDLSQHPFAAPDALYAALQREYAAALGGLAYESEEERAEYLREVRRWINQIKLNRRSAVEWLVELKSLGSPQTQVAECEFVALWPDTGEPIGEPFRVRLEGRDAIRVLETPAEPRWILSASIAARPVLNESREKPGVFNAPRLIGPFVEFDYELTVRSIRPAPDDASSK